MFRQVLVKKKKRQNLSETKMEIMNEILLSHLIENIYQKQTGEILRTVFAKKRKQAQHVSTDLIMPVVMCKKKDSIPTSETFKY